LDSDCDSAANLVNNFINLDAENRLQSSPLVSLAENKLFISDWERWADILRYLKFKRDYDLNRKIIKKLAWNNIEGCEKFAEKYREIRVRSEKYFKELIDSDSIQNKEYMFINNLKDDIDMTLIRYRLKRSVNKFLVVRYSNSNYGFYTDIKEYYDRFDFFPIIGGHWYAFTFTPFIMVNDSYFRVCYFNEVYEILKEKLNMD
jgi:hypothetical protein